MAGIDLGSVLTGGAKGAAAGAILGPVGSAFGGAIGVALELAPQLSRWLVGDDGSTAGKIVEVVRTATGTSDPAAQAAIVANPTVAADLRIKLAQIAADREKAREQTFLEEVKVAVSDRDSARKQTQTLAASGSPMAWGAPIVSVLVTLGFFGTMAMVFFGPPILSTNQTTILNILVGTLAAMFTNACSYWLGSSAGSARKDERQNQLLLTAATAPAVPPTSPVEPIPPVVMPPGSWQPGQPVVLDPAPPVAKPAPTQRFMALHTFVQAQEGGWADHPQDPGGATNKGITLATFRAWRENPAATKDDLRAITDQETAEICFANYWNVCRCDALPPGVDLSVYDMAINAGPRRSVMLLQKVLRVAEDGVVGSVTLTAVGQMSPVKVIEGLYDAQEGFYRSLPTFGTFGSGWLKRVAERRAMALREAGTVATA